MESVMLLSGAGGNSSQSADDFQLLEESANCQPIGSITAHQQSLQQNTQHSSGQVKGWMLNGFTQQPHDPGQAQQQFEFPHTTQQQLQHFAFPQSLQQQQISPLQAQLDVQMAQLHNSLAQQQQQAALQLAQAAGAAAGGTGHRQRVSSDGQWFTNDVSSQLKQAQVQLGSQQPPGAISALRQGLSLQQQQQTQLQQQLGASLQDILLQGGWLQKQATEGSVTHTLHAAAGTAAASNSNIANHQHQPATASAGFSADGNNKGAAAGLVTEPDSNSQGKTLPNSTPSSNLTVRMTLQLVGTYSKCTPPARTTPTATAGGSVGGLPQLLVRRVLTKPGAGIKNDGWDNEASDLVLTTQDVLVNAAGQRYVVLDMLGSGTFGQVVSCYSESEGRPVAVKVIKNQPAYYHQARVEVGILQLLNGRCDPHDAHHIVRLQDAFLHKHHLCLAFEQLGINLFELLKRNGFRGLSLGLLRLFLQQILDALIILRDAAIIHCDLKPENILLAPPAASGGALGQLKLIDFGSACFEHRTVYSYIQSRFYRSPEVMLGLSYTASIDMWSFGCVAAELFLGLPLFPGACEHDLLSRIMETLGPPPAWMMAAAKRTTSFFKKVPSASGAAMAAHAVSAGDGYAYVLYRKEEYEAANSCQAPAGKRYFSHTRLADIVGHYPFKQGATDAEESQERKQREALLDLLIGVLDLDPKTRWTPRQAIKHPFITGEPFTGPYQPAADSPPQPIHHHHHHSQRHQHQHSPEQQQQIYAAAAAAAAAVGSYSSGLEQHVGSQIGGRTGPVAMQACSAAHHQQQQQQHAAAAAAGMLQATPTGSFIAPGSFPTVGAGSLAAGSTSQLLQYSPAAAQVHARAHAIAMAALQQLSPQLGSSYQAPSASQLLGSSVSNRSTGSYIPPSGMSLMQQQQQQQMLSSSYSPARPLIPSGRAPSSGQHQHLLRQQLQQGLPGTSADLAAQQAPTAMVTSPAPLTHSQQGTAFANTGLRAGSFGSAGAAAGDYLSGSGSLAQSFNHNLLMSPVNSMAAMLAAARQQQQQQAAAAAASSMSMAGSIPRGASLQQRWRAAMEQQPAPGLAGISMQFGAQQQQLQHQHQQYQQPASWQQGPAVGLLGQSVAPAVDSNVMLQWQHIQQAQRQQSMQAAAALAARAAASSSGISGIDLSSPQQTAQPLGAGVSSVLPRDGRGSLADGSGSLAQGPRPVRNSSSGGNLANRTGGRVSSADDVMFVMEESAGSGASSRQHLNCEQQPQHQALLAQQQQQMVQRPAVQPELIASSPLELPSISEQHANVRAGQQLLQLLLQQQSYQPAAQQPSQHAVAPLHEGSATALHPLQHQQPHARPQQHQQPDNDLELQEEEVLCEEHPGDWNPLYTDEQLLDEHSSPSPKAAAASVTAAGPVPGALGSSQVPGLLSASPGAVVGAALAAAEAAGQGHAAVLGPAVAGPLHSKSRRGSMIHIRSMSVDIPNVPEEDLGPGLPDAEAAAAGLDVVRPSVAGGRNTGTPDAELDVTLNRHWSFRQPSQLLRNPVQGQQQAVAAVHEALLWPAGSSLGQSGTISDLEAGESLAEKVRAGAGAPGQHKSIGSGVNVTGVSRDTGLGLLTSPDAQARPAEGSDQQLHTLLSE